jgi:3-phenylpropionate/trans-cinnamate dioxygenase ferredoxin reductase component
VSTETGTVLIGAGLAAAHTIETLRERGYTEPITLIGDEAELPYERPALSKSYLQGKSGDLQVHDARWYADQGVDIRTGTRAVGIDRDARRVRLDGADPVPYGHLVVATGARPRTLGLPGADLPGVYTLRTRADSDRLRDALARDERWVIVGGGWIGLEVAAAARDAGRTVTVLEYAQLPLHRVLGERLGRYFLQLHLGNDVDLRTGVSAGGIEASPAGLAVRVGEEVLDADAVVLAVGVRPNTELAADAGLAVDNGIVVDQQLRTSDPRILAAGDVAAAHNTRLGRRLRVEHWDNAIRQGRLAASTILGGGAAYDWHPYFFTDQYDLGMEYVGHGHPDDQVVIRGSLLSGEFLAFWLADGRVTAAMNVNIWDVNDDLRRLVGREIPTYLLTDPTVPLADL